MAEGNGWAKLPQPQRVREFLVQDLELSFARQDSSYSVYDVWVGIRMGPLPCVSVGGLPVFSVLRLCA